MLPKSIVTPLPKRIENIEDVRNWIEKFLTTFTKSWDRLANEFVEGEHFICVGDDGKHIHGFVARKEDFVI